MATLPYVRRREYSDHGTSYVGYSNHYTLLTHPGVFTVCIANSPGYRLAVV